MRVLVVVVVVVVERWHLVVGVVEWCWRWTREVMVGVVVVEK